MTPDPELISEEAEDALNLARETIAAILAVLPPEVMSF